MAAGCNSISAVKIEPEPATKSAVRSACPKVDFLIADLIAHLIECSGFRAFSIKWRIKWAIKWRKTAALGQALIRGCPMIPTLSVTLSLTLSIWKLPDRQSDRQSGRQSAGIGVVRLS